MKQMSEWELSWWKKMVMHATYNNVSCRWHAKIKKFQAANQESPSYSAFPLSCYAPTLVFFFILQIQNRWEYLCYAQRGDNTRRKIMKRGLGTFSCSCFATARL